METFLIVYISGRISGLDIKEVTESFKSCAMLIKVSGHIPINPLNIKPLFGIKNYWCHMLADIWELLWCDTVWLQPNWKESRGARIEHFIAKLISKNIYYQ